jgi:hypothetical protein
LRYFEEGCGDANNQTWVKKGAILGHSGIWAAFKCGTLKKVAATPTIKPE